MNPIRKNIPNSITCLNLLGGVVAIILASRGSEMLGALPAYQWAFICIGISAVADFLDGFASRLLDAYSPLGKELDSLCDLVSFGVAPALLLFYSLQTLSPAHEWLPWVSLVIPVAGALRLARFNIDDRQTTSFIGLPIPANAIFWIGFISMAYEHPGFVATWYWILPIILLAAWLMVSPLPLISFKFKKLAVKGNEYRLLILLTAVILICCLQMSGLMWSVVAYVIISMKATNDKKETGK